MSIILKFRLLEAYEYDMMHRHSPAAASPKSQNDQMKVKEDFNQKMQLIFFFSELDFELNRAKKKFKKNFLNFSYMAETWFPRQSPRLIKFCVE